MTIETRVELLAEHGLPQFSKMLSRARKVGYYTPDGLYELTFGQQGADIDPLVDLMQTQKLTERKKVLEIFGGSAFESLLLKREFPKNTFHSLDIVDYYDKAKGIEYLIGNAFSPAAVPEKMRGAFDFVFVGHTNKSCCSILSLKDFISFSKYCHTVAKKGGVVSISFFEDTGIDYNDFFIEYTCTKIKYKKMYKGFYCHWAQISRRDLYKKNHWYYPLIMISKYENIDDVVGKKDGLEAFLYSEAGKYRSWDTAIVAEIMEMQGFEFLGDKLFPDGEIFPFIKK